MATNTEVAGISIGITADVTGLQTSLNVATQKVDNWLRTMQKPNKFAVTIEAKKGTSWDGIERDLEAIIERVTKGHSVPINVDLAIDDPQGERARLEGIIKGQLGALKTALKIDYTAKVLVTADWEWGEGPDGPGAPPGRGGGGGSPGPRRTTTRRGRRTATGDDEVETPGPTDAPPEAAPAPAKPKKARRAAASTVKARPAAPAPVEAEEEPAAVSGIAAMSTATPKTAAQRKQAETIAANTEAHQAATEAARVWKDVTRATFMGNLRRPIEGLQPLRVRPEMLEGATGYQAEYEGRTPTGAVSYVNPAGQRVRLLRSRTPRTFEGTTHGERPTEGRVTESRRPDYDDPRRGLGDMRSMRWFDPGGGFDPEVRRESKRLFDEAMAAREEEIFKKLGPVLEAREGETHEEHRARLMRDWTSEGWGFNAGKTISTSAKALEGIAQGLKLPPEVKALDDLRVQEKFGEFFGEAEPGALALRAASMSQIRARSVATARERKGEELTEQERKAALSKGTQRASRLRGGNAVPDPKRPEETLYVQLNAMIGQAFAEQFYAEQQLRQQQATAQGVETRLHREMVGAYAETEGFRPNWGSKEEQMDWDQGLRDFAETFKPSGPKKGQKRGPRVNAAAIPETDLQKQIAALREEFEQLEVFEVEGDPRWSPERYAELEEKLADIAAGGFSGSARQRGGPGWDPPSDDFALMFADALEEMVRNRRASGRPNPQAIANIYGSQKEYDRWNAPLTPAEERYEDEYMDWAQGLPPEVAALLRREHDERFRPSPEELDIIDAARAGAPRMAGSAGLRNRIQQGPPRPEGAPPPPPPKEEPFVPVWRRRDQSAVRQPRSLEGSGRRRSRSELEGLGATPIEVPDVRDIASAMGLGRGGFGTSGARTKITQGSRDKMQRLVKGTEVEKVFALIGDRYIDEAGRVLNDIREVIELETDPSKTSATGFAVSGAGLERLRRHVGQRGMGMLGMAHGIGGHGLQLSEPGRAAVPGQDDASVLKRVSQELPGFISGVVDPATREGMRFYQQGPEGPVRRAVNIAGNIPRMVPEPVQAQAAMPVTAPGAGALFASLSDEAKAQHVQDVLDSGAPMPDYARAWLDSVSQQTQQGMPLTGINNNIIGVQAGMWDPAALAAGQMGGGFRWRMGAAGGGVAAAGGAFFGNAAPPPPVGPPAGQMGFGWGGGVPPGGGGPPLAVAGLGGVPPGTVKKFQRSTASVREQLLQAGFDITDLNRLESTHEAAYIQSIQEADQISGQIQEDIGKTPVRAFTTAIGQYASQALVRGEVGERRIAAQTIGRMFRKSAGEKFEFGTRRDMLQKELDTGLAAGTLSQDEITSKQAEIDFQTKGFQRAETETEQLGIAFAEARKGIAPLGVQMANLVTITGSMMIAGAAFQVGMQAMSLALEGLLQVTNEGMEAATGYNATLKRVQAALSEQAMETGGVRGAVAGGFAAAGMEPSASQRAALEGQIGAVTATNRFAVQRDMLRSLENLRSAAPGAAEFGIAPGLVRPTGGMFGTVIGAQQSLDEIIGNELERLSPGGVTGMWNAGMERAPFTGNPFEGTFELFGLTEAGKQRERAQLDFAENLNSELDQAGNAARFAVGEAFFQSPEAMTQAAALDEIGANEIAAAVRDGAFEIRDANGEIVTAASELAQIVKDLGEALETPSGRELYRAGEKERRAAMMGIEDQFSNATNIINPITDWRRLALNRPLAFGTGWNSGDPSSQAAQAAFGGGFQDSMASLNRRMAEGRRGAINLGVDPADIQRLEDFGEQIRGINTDLAARSLEVSTAAYNQQLKMATYNLEDIRGITGQIGEGTSAIGRAQGENLRLQRENVEIGRRMTERQMELTQGQINYNLAVSRFSGGGATAAEAFARQEQARIEAAFAQASLDDQRAMFENEGVINRNTIMVVDEQNLRALEQAVFAVEQLDRERQLEKYSAAAEQFLGVLTAEAEILGAEIDAQIARGMGYVTLAQEEIRRVYVESGEILTGVSEDIQDAFKQIREDYDEWLGDLTPLGEKGFRTGSKSPTGDRYATGGLFNTSGMYHMTVGEAGKETVAVLRNPRQMMVGGEGGGTTININNPVVRDETDIQAIARAVEDVLNRRTALLGMNRVN